MAEFPAVGISREELEAKIRREFQAYLASIGSLRVYENSEEDLRELFRVGKVAPEVAQGVVDNIATLHRKTFEFGTRHERVSCLLALYKQFFPDFELEFLDAPKLEKMIQHNLGVREQKYECLVKRLAANLNQSVSSLYSSSPFSSGSSS